MFAAWETRKDRLNDVWQQKTVDTYKQVCVCVCALTVILMQNSCVWQKNKKKIIKKSQLWIKLIEASSHLCLLQAMMEAAQRTARCTPTGTSGSRNHAGSVCVTTVRSCVMRSSVMSCLTVRRWWSLRASAAPFVRWTHPMAVDRAPLVSKETAYYNISLLKTVMSDLLTVNYCNEFFSIAIVTIMWYFLLSARQVEPGFTRYAILYLRDANILTELSLNRLWHPSCVHSGSEGRTWWCSNCEYNFAVKGQ